MQPEYRKHDFDAVVLDMDGVIFDSERVTMECWIELANRYGIKNIREPYLASAGTNAARGREIMMEAYGPDFPHDELAAEASRMYHERYDGGRLPMKPGVFELLDALKESGKAMAIASSTRSSTVLSQLRDARILPYFGAVICGDMVEKSKPAPDIFLEALRALGVVPGRAYGIEDSYNGVRAISAAGMHPVMVPDLLPPTEEMEELSEIILPDLSAAAKYLCGQAG